MTRSLSHLQADFNVHSPFSMTRKRCSEIIPNLQDNILRWVYIVYLLKTRAIESEHGEQPVSVVCDPCSSFSLTLRSHHQCANVWNFSTLVSDYLLQQLCE